MQRKKYTKEFKLAAISLVKEQGYTRAEAARSLGINDMFDKQYFTNVGIKLANCFIQQANLLSKLQGHSGQRMVVEHVTIHSGAQAIVGNINRGPPISEVKK